MSDYFAALNRSAGPVRERRDPMLDHPGLVEQDVEHVSDSRITTPASPPLLHTERATIAAEAPHPYDEPTATAAHFSHQDVEPVTPLAAPLAPKISLPAAAPQPASAELPEGLVRHEAVRAALRWVAADPIRQQAPSTMSIIDEAPRRANHPAIHQPLDAPRPTVKDAPTPDAEPASIAIQNAAPAARDTAQRPRRARALGTEATVIDRIAEEKAPLHEERVEVSIGTIHVRVDAPPPPAVVAQSMQAPQPQPERREERSSFSRCRIPRV